MNQIANIHLADLQKNGTFYKENTNKKQKDYDFRKDFLIK